MRTALVTTTINVPHVLRLYRALDAHVRFFVAGDWKTPLEANILMGEIGNAWMIFPEMQWSWACSDPIGWNCIQRRNIATLEALKWGADLIINIDDDNIPLDSYYFHAFKSALTEMTQTGWQSRHFNGLRAVPPNGWWSAYGAFPHRGFPIGVNIETAYDFVVDTKVGVAAGVCLGDPDIDAYTRLSQAPFVHEVGEVTRAGYIVDPNMTRTVFNSQNTAFVRELAPAMFMLPGIGRHDDIYASLICQRVMRDRGYVTHFGPPFVWQQRNAHNLINDLKAEIFGMEHIVEFADWLDVLDLGQAPVLNQVRLIYGKMSDLKWMPAQAHEAGLAWCDDVERVL